MESITFGQCVKGAWRDAWRFVRHRPMLVAVLLVVEWAATLVESVLYPDRTPPFRIIAFVPLGLFVLVMWAVFSVVVVQALRFLLPRVGEADVAPLSGRALFDRDYWRYLGVVWAIGVLIFVVLAIAAGVMGVAFSGILLLARHRLLSLPVMVSALAVPVPALVSACWAMFYISARFNLLSTHVAIGGAMRIRDTWADTRGHCWSIWATRTVALLPMTAITSAWNRGGAAVLHHLRSPVFAVLYALAGVVSICVAAGCSAWLYRRYAASLLAKA